MMHDEQAASPRWKLNPKNFGPNTNYVNALLVEFTKVVLILLCYHAW